ncbi:MAG: hypothetical protein N3D77_12880 [Geminicoccaceae bacterium]|nr:hypothetical protein [Geminicoccaceae bacterium]
MAALLWHLKRTLPLSAVDGRDPGFELLLRLWYAGRRDGLLPARAALERADLRRLVPEASWLEPPAAGAAGALGRLAAVAEAVAAEPQAARRRLGDLLLEDQRTVRFTGCPLLQDLVVESPVALERWRQLLLPTAEDGVRVGALLELVRLVASEAKLVERPAPAAGGSGALRPRPVPTAAAAGPAAVRDGADGSAARRASRETPRR